MNEDILVRSSQNIATLLQLFILHEENIARLSRPRQESNPLGDLINIVFTSETQRRNTQTQANARNERRNAQNRARNENNENNENTDPAYSEHQYSNLIDPIYRECPITQEAFQDTDRVVMVRPCRHLFKRDPFHEWIQISQTCPYCRAPL